MSEDTNENTTLTDAVSPADGRTDLPEGDGAVEQENSSEGHSGSKLHREAAGYRVKLRETEAERDALAERLQRMQRAEIERLASDALSHPADLFSLSGNELADYLTEDGDVDAEKVAADVAAILAERPGLRKQIPGYDPSQGRGGRPPAKREPKSLGDVIRF
ncbi:hypothetical protein LIX17_20225 [Mycobacterium avium subsp. hominissuis]|uniref:DUF4355 domain-containing protein n=2 Tax=Mycobacterium avium TaxID=1764 RepID=A0A2A3L183_MYCAV|nr:hypothetical protein [Mycobacterium avium]MCA4733638.1 hypothetical protein [Mycobacterium avium subsp. hominissuis]MCA4737757.1 hypothetical protein [Mycobacterium avium subsp. hominissuis]MCA4744146.1 hypothetical protein [Mycobacterium avium subsp. hominissuis]MCA4764877.1 hypothetical protein [Mycobacterium avium subsp. hominissuis]PBA24803.1 hypothetical protein CKJ66_21625 [Mycobacterium avium]